MATNQQLMLARQPMPSLGSKSAKPAVAPFPQKLYEMVNESATDNLIRWSDDGNSFYVLDQERFAGDVLGRWFKHRNFSSFVRQLNMYAFHKIPQLQQGVLKSSTETEVWQFEHEHFRRGHPELVHLIQRKKASPLNNAEDSANAAALALLTASLNNSSGNHEVASPQGSVGSPALGHGELDTNQVINGITAIKRHQALISNELSELKESNRQLWQEAITARERHKKHQDTINRILRFLAGVFAGGVAGPHHADAEDRTTEERREPTVPRKRQRLMISDGSDVRPNGPHREPVEKDSSGRGYGPNLGPPSPERFAPIDTPSPSVVPSDTFSPLVSDTPLPLKMNLHTPTEKPFPLFSDTRSTSVPAPVPASASAPPLPAQPPFSSSALLPTSPSPEQNLQAVFNQIMQSPEQMQRLLQAFNVQNQTPFTFPSPPLPPPNPPADFTQPQTWTGNTNTLAHPQPTHPQTHSVLPGQPNSLIPSPPRSADLQTDALRNMYQSTEDVEHEVDTLKQSIEGFIASLGLDPDTLASHPLPNGHIPPGPPHSRPDADAQMDTDDEQPAPGADFDFDAFLNDLQAGAVAGGVPHVPNGFGAPPALPDMSHLNGRVAGANEEELTAFLDEVASQASTDGRRSPDVSNGARRASGRKRKSDVAQLSPSLTEASVTSDVSSHGAKPRQKNK